MIKKEFLLLSNNTQYILNNNNLHTSPLILELNDLLYSIHPFDFIKQYKLWINYQPVSSYFTPRSSKFYIMNVSNNIISINIASPNQSIHFKYINKNKSRLEYIHTTSFEYIEIKLHPNDIIYIPNKWFYTIMTDNSNVLEISCFNPITFGLSIFTI
jgi:hypothetical protein